MSMPVAVSPGHVAEQLIGRDYLSYSALSTYQQCSLRFYFKYVLRLEESAVAASLVFGGAMHQALEYHFRELLIGRQPSELSTLMDVYQSAWHERSQAEVRFAPGEDAAALSRLAGRMLAAFRTHELAAPDGTVLAVERSLRAPLIPGCPDLLGRVDLVVETDAALVVTDLKTARSRWSSEQVENAGDQLLLYAPLVAQLAADKPLRLEFAVLTKSKLPEVKRHWVQHDSGRLQRTREIFRRVWQSIEAGNFYPSPSPLACPNCPFRGPCRQWGSS